MKLSIELNEKLFSIYCQFYSEAFEYIEEYETNYKISGGQTLNKLCILKRDTIDRLKEIKGKYINET